MKNLKSQSKLAAAITLSLAALAAPNVGAQETKPADEVTFNAAVTTDYRYRGVSQSRLNPALSAGADYVNTPSGLYVGTWLSTIKWTKDAGGDGHVEWDIYGGKRGEIAPGITYDVGGLYYFYPSNGLPTSANTFELYGQVGYGPGYIKYSHSTTNLFGTSDSKNSGYLDIGANFEVATGLVLNLHAGRQNVANNGAFSYTDYKVGLTKDFGIVSVSLAVISADTRAYVSPAGKNLGKTAAVLSVSKTF
ncbi:MAG: TorF family putative porin [Pseudomonadota bacterium]